MAYMPQATTNSFFASPTTIEEVINTINNLQNRGNNLNSIPVLIYKKTAVINALIIVDIFNCSVINEGIFPELFKLVRTVPIYKNGDRKLVANYRSISIVHTLSKIIEKLMKIRVMQYLEKENIICSKQFVFRAGYSTSNAIVEIVDKIVHSLDNKLYTVVVFLDLTKVFDTVNRDIFVNKMERLSFRGSIFNWFKDYLTNRRIFTDIGCHSDVRALNIGLPQGTVSSPYCFSIYINDMHRCSDKLNFVHFADDTTEYASVSNL